VVTVGTMQTTLILVRQPDILVVVAIGLEHKVNMLVVLLVGAEILVLAQLVKMVTPILAVVVVQHTKAAMVQRLLQAGLA